MIKMSVRAVYLATCGLCSKRVIVSNKDAEVNCHCDEKAIYSLTPTAGEDEVDVF